MSERLEGRVSVLAALEAGQRTFEAILTGPGFDKWKNADILDAAKKRGIAVKAVGEEEFGSQAKSHGGLAAIAGAKPMTAFEDLPAIAEKNAPAFFVLLEGADDPRNLGYVLRTAEALGAHAVIIKRREWDLDSTAVSRASSGSFERMQIALARRDSKEFAPLKKMGLKLLGCVPQSKYSIYQTDLKVPLILAVGGEKRGLSGDLREECDRLVSIPTAGGPTSLSMTQAAAIVIAEAARQRKI